MIFRSVGVAVLVLIPWLGTCFAAGAQVVAKQGEVQEKVVFKSPMVLELPFAKVRGLDQGEGTPFKGLETYVCDDTRLTRLVVTRTRASERKGDVYTFDGTVAVGNSHDRWVTIDLDLVLLDAVLAKASVVDLDAEEEKERDFQLKLEVPAEATARLFAAEGQGAQFRLKVSVQDNNTFDGYNSRPPSQAPKKRRY